MSKIEIKCAALYSNPTLLKNWPIFLETVAQAQSSIFLEYKSSFYTNKPIHNRENAINKATENSYSSNSYNNHIITTICKNLQAYSQGCRGCRGCGSHNSHSSYRK